MSLFTSIWQFLSVAKLPRVALSFTEDSIVAAQVRKKRGEFHIEKSASVSLPKALVNPDFLQANISDPNMLAKLIRQVTEQAGLRRESRWSVALPEGVARTHVINLDVASESNDELEETINWRLERMLTIEASRLRIVKQPIDNSQQKFLVTTVEKNVISEYENVFNQAGLYAGMLMPRHLCEAILLGRDKSPADKLLISHNHDGFVSVFLRDDKPVMVRPHMNCPIDEREAELYRLIVYYREKIVQQSIEVPLHVLVVGNDQEMEISQSILADALHDFKFSILNMDQLGVKVTNTQKDTTQLTAAAGLASLGYS